MRGQACIDGAGGRSRLMVRFDLLVVGGGINGVGIARDAVGRGLSVLLVERGDLGGATSSASSKLIHGGLRYLEHGEFSLVAESLRERATMLRIAPHLVRPVRFVLPHFPTMRPRWMLRLGLFLYDLLQGKTLPHAVGVRFDRDPVGAPLRDGLRKGFIYADCAVDDARLVVLTARDAADRGAEIRTHTEFRTAMRKDGVWRASLARNGQDEIIEARAIANVAGPWVGEGASRIDGKTLPVRAIRLVKGSHIVVDRLYDGDQAYTLQAPDGRVVFAIPFQRDFTLIGTTDMPVEHDPARVSISQGERDYLRAVANSCFRKQLTDGDIRWTYAGVRPLLDDGHANASQVTRDYKFDIDAPDGLAPLLSVYGGKLTTYRHLAERATDKLTVALGRRQERWTSQAPLPGGDAAYASLVEEAPQRWPFLPDAMRARLLAAYGTRVTRVLGEARSLAELGTHFGADLYEAELLHLKRDEWATCADDALWRRSKLGLRLNDAERRRVDAWFSTRRIEPQAG
ncbi:MAG: glpD [Rhodospirillales bacterium]|nr:glpD [Rhodospirillales bacterium]